MQSIPKNEILEFREDTLVSVRKEYDLDKPGRMDQAIGALEEWVKKQDHFIKKIFRLFRKKNYFLQRIGRANKKKLDKYCTLKTLMPLLYETISLRVDYKDSNIILDGLLPKQSEDHYRIYVLRNIGQHFDNKLTNYFRYLIMLAEYATRHDYTKGVILVLDYMEANIFELALKLDLEELRQAITLLLEGYGMRVKGIHFITPSKSIELIVKVFKQVLSAKLGERIQIHCNYESLHKVVSKDLLPIELGGTERSVAELHEQWIDILSSKEFQEYFREMKKAATNEKFRQTDKLNDEYMGMPGTFRTLNLD